MASDVTKSTAVADNYEVIINKTLGTLNNEQAKSLTGALRARLMGEMINASLQTAYQIVANGDTWSLKSSLLTEQVNHEKEKIKLVQAQTSQLIESVKDNKLIKGGDQLYAFMSEMVGNDFVPSTDLMSYAFKISHALASPSLEDGVSAPVASSGTVSKV